MRGSKVIMPVSPMKSNPTVGDIGIPRHAWQIENGELIRPAEHMVSRAFVEGMEQPDRAFEIPPSSGYPGRVDQGIPFIGQEQLPVEIDLDMLFVLRNLRRIEAQVLPVKRDAPRQDGCSNETAWLHRRPCTIGCHPVYPLPHCDPMGSGIIQPRTR